jgi:alkylation response protein AidB-like acyl-CoA dehydrogenase
MAQATSAASACSTDCAPETTTRSNPPAAGNKFSAKKRAVATRAACAGSLSPADAAIAKLFVSETAFKVIDNCLQLFGGYGYMDEYPISRLYRDVRIDRIHGGTSEIMKTIIARSL